ncbi:MAG TPA: type II toxin-antitoxin system RelE/ParE family toxin [Gammaproteobacteria bacterium]|nr:type II toxin-antitoxin system RelE/ParE family toxin [Gammaproteobacteria bacterium]
MAKAPKLPVRFYRTEAGNEPVREWLKSLSQDDRKIIGDDIRTLQFGWPIGMLLNRSLGGGLNEVRCTLGSNRIARVMFAVKDGSAVLLHGFIKKSRTTPKSDLELARDRLKRL